MKDSIELFAKVIATIFVCAAIILAVVFIGGGFSKDREAYISIWGDKFMVMLDRSFGDDRPLFISEDVKEAEDFLERWDERKLAKQGVLE